MRILSAVPLALALAGAAAGTGRPALDGARAVPAPLTIRLEDFILRLEDGAAIRARPGVLVLSGKGTVAFAPPLASERRQLALFGGSPSLEDAFEEAYLRVAPGRMSPLLPGGAERPGPVADALRRSGERIAARAERESPFSGELAPGDFVALVRTRRHGPLAFLRLSSEPEDMMMIDVAGKRRIALYPSAAHRKAFGFDYGDEYRLPYAVSRYDLDVSVDPDRDSLSGEARLRLTALEPLDAAALRLDPALSVSTVRIEDAPAEFYRPPGSDRLFVRFDPPLDPFRSVHVAVRYAGRVQPQTLEGNDPFLENGAPASASPEARYALFSNRIWWYPQSGVHDHATATLRVRVPPGTTAIAPGVRENAADGPVFRIDPPVRYLALLAGRFVTVSEDPADGLRPALEVVSTADRVSQARRLAPEIGPILDFYGDTIGKGPYPSLTVAVVPSRFPAGHSPAGLTVVGIPAAPFRVDDNPSFDRVEPSFQLAHELAHQWWGQAVGWRNYRQQWLSEAFAQYFAALYVRHARGEKAFGRILAWLDRWADRAAGRGPVDLGVRAGAVTGERWVFPAVVYDRGALALDALRRRLGDATFFHAVRSYYRCRRFDRADADDLRGEMEAASGRNLGEFFDVWIDGDEKPGAR